MDKNQGKTIKNTAFYSRKTHKVEEAFRIRDAGDETYVTFRKGSKPYTYQWYDVSEVAYGARAVERLKARHHLPQASEADIQKLDEELIDNVNPGEKMLDEL